MSTVDRFSHSSRRTFLQISAIASAAMVFRIASEPTLAAAQRKEKVFPPGSVVIDSNENPLGPCELARKAVVDIVPQGGRYSDWMTRDLTNLFAESQGLNADYVRVYPGSSEPLHFSVLAFTSPSKSYVTADPGYEAGMGAAKFSGARVIKVPLTKTYAHDVAAMLTAAPDAGLFYICTPNNPTGTLTPHSQIERLVNEKPKGSVVLVDEAYIHFSDATSAIDLVKADKDVIVLRTFSKIYGMAGLRCGVAIARPDLLAKLSALAGWSPMPITAVAAAMASLKEPRLCDERKAINAAIRQRTFDWLDRNGYSYVPSSSNCFMVDTKRPAQKVIDALAARNVFIGRTWPVWPTYTRITVGTQEEMEAFQAAFHEVMSNTMPFDVALRGHLD
jgi:histidinol-phosphate aminotransferase